MITVGEHAVCVVTVSIRRLLVTLWLMFACL